MVREGGCLTVGLMRELEPVEVRKNIGGKWGDIRDFIIETSLGGMRSILAIAAQYGLSFRRQVRNALLPQPLSELGSDR